MPTYPLPNLSASLASELAGMVAQVAEPYRTRLVDWLSQQAQRGPCALATLPPTSLEQTLSAWLDEFDPVAMTEHYVLLRQVVCQAQRIFGEEHLQCSP